MNHFNLMLIAWSELSLFRNWTRIAISATGQYQTATARNDSIYTSLDYGSSMCTIFQYSVSPTSFCLLCLIAWVPVAFHRFWTGLSMSSLGNIQSATAFESNIYTSTNYGSSELIV